METIGKGIEHTELKVVDPKSGKMVEFDQPGELLTRGYNSMIGYWDDDAKTDETFTRDRFFRTGDLVQMDQDGYVRFIGRSKDLIIRGGENIYPREIEELLHKHPKVADVYVVGVPDERMIEELCACVKLNPGESDLTAQDVREFCLDKISKHKIPRYVELVDTFPMTVTGKIQKNILGTDMAEKLGLSHIQHIKIKKKTN